MTDSTDIVLITGATRGIGREIARQLAGTGRTVLVGARDPAAGDAVAAELGEPARPVTLDVTEPASVTAAAEAIQSRYGRLDVLINNAGIALDGFTDLPSRTSLDTLRRTYETNVFGVVSVTNAMLPLLRRAPAGRVVNLSSTLGSIGTWADPDSEQARSTPALAAYSSSKSALNALTVAYARELAGAGIQVAAVCPGYTATDLNGHTGPRTVQQGAAIAVRLAAGNGVRSGVFVNDDGPIPW